MPFILHSRRDREEAADFLRVIMQTFLFHGTDPAMREKLLAYITWMKAQQEPLTISCRFESFPEARGARLTLDTAFAPKLPANAIKLS